MDNKTSNGEHKLNLYDRHNGQITGIKKVVSMEENQIILITGDAKMIIKGAGLHVGKLDVKSGEMEFTGQVNSLVYTEYTTAGQKAAGLVGRLFK